MKKIFFVLMALMFVSCSVEYTTDPENPEKTYKLSDFFNLEFVASNSTGTSCIYVDTNTGVLYYLERINNYSYSYVPVYNADGSLKNISQYQ